jgi:hypothetical protein
LARLTSTIKQWKINYISIVDKKLLLDDDKVNTFVEIVEIKDATNCKQKRLEEESDSDILPNFR